MAPTSHHSPQELWYPFNLRLGKAQSKFGRFRRKKNLLSQLKIEPHIIHPIV